MTRVAPGAEPFAYHGGPVGFLLIHGFTGSPGAARPMGEWLAARGHTVACPRLPGHGTHWQQLGRTRWQDWSAEAIRALKDLDARVETLIVFGLSFGGVLGLHLAVRYPDAVRAVVLVNPWLKDRLRESSRYLKYVIRTGKGVINDIKKPGQDEIGYERVPVKAVAEATALQRIVRKELPRVRQPLLIFQSTEDHAIPAGSTELILERAGSTEKEVVELTNSYHVATLDYDAELIFERTHEFAEAHAVRVDHAGERLHDDDTEGVEAEATVDEEPAVGPEELAPAEETTGTEAREETREAEEPVDPGREAGS